MPCRTRGLVPGLLACALLAAPASAQLQLREVAAEAGVVSLHDPTGMPPGADDNLNVFGPGVAWADLNADGWPDLVHASGPSGPRAFLNNGDGSFEEATAWLGGPCDLPSSSVLPADLDADGYPEIFLGQLFEEPWLLLGGRANFSSEAAALRGVAPVFGGGVGSPPPETMGWALGDYNRDGRLDLAAAHYRLQPDQLYRGLGGADFQRTTLLQGQVSRWGFQPLWWDFDDDGDQDLYMVNDFGRNQLYENQGPGAGWAMEEVAISYNVSGGGGFPDPASMSMGVAVGDFDNDLDLDLYITNFIQNALYVNKGLGNRGLWRFEDEAGPRGVRHQQNCWGTGFGDLDHDGDLDLVLTGGWITADRVLDQGQALPNKLYRNRGAPGYGFDDHTAQAGAGGQDFADTGHSGRGLALADYDRDGDLDLAIANNSWYPDVARPDSARQEGPLQLWRNELPVATNWVALHLRGAGNGSGGGCHPLAPGASARLSTAVGTQRRDVHIGGSYLSLHEPVLHFGLGGAATVDSLVVRWPCGSTERFAGVSPGGYYELREGEGSARPWRPALTALRARFEDGAMRLDWNSAPWLVAPDFTVERKRAGEDGPFEPLALDIMGAGGEYAAVDSSLVPGGSYLYRVAMDDAGGPAFSALVVPAEATATPPGGGARLGQNYPNPFGGETLIQLRLATSEQVSVRIYDLRGRLVRRLFDGAAGPSTPPLRWDGRDDAGNRMPSGKYVYVLQGAAGSDARRLTLRR